VRLFLRPFVTVVTALLLVATVLAPTALAQDFDIIVDALERDGYFIENGADGSPARFQRLVEQGQAGDGDEWYFVSLNQEVPESFADDLYETLRPQGNVLVFYYDNDDFANVLLATSDSVASSTQDRALDAFDDDWVDPEDFMEDVVAEFKSLTGSSNSSGSAGSGSAGSSSGGSTVPSASTGTSSGGGFPWMWVLIPLLLLGGFWFMRRKGKNAKDETHIETAQKIRAELQTELDELANDVLVLSGPTDVSENKQAIEYYREATDTYLDISDELPDVIKTLEQADIKELSEIGARVANARWQMDAAEALIEGEPVPEKPKVKAPPPPPRKQQRPPRQQRPMPQRQARPRVPYSRSRRRSGGGLLDILIAGAGMMGNSRGRGGGMFGGGNRSRGGGMFGGGNSSRGRSSRSQPLLIQPLTES